MTADPSSTTADAGEPAAGAGVPCQSGPDPCAGTAIRVAWGSTECRIADVAGETEIAPDHHETYRRAEALVTGAIQDGIDLPGP